MVRRCRPRFSAEESEGSADLPTSQRAGWTETRSGPITARRPARSTLPTPHASAATPDGELALQEKKPPPGGPHKQSQSLRRPGRRAHLVSPPPAPRSASPITLNHHLDSPGRDTGENKQFQAGRFGNPHCKCRLTAAASHAAPTPRAPPASRRPPPAARLSRTKLQTPRPPRRVPSLCPSSVVPSSVLRPSLAALHGRSGPSRRRIGRRLAREPDEPHELPQRRTQEEEEQHGPRQQPWQPRRRR